MGYIQEAAKLGFTIYETRDLHPKYVTKYYTLKKKLDPVSHRHVRFALFFHSLAMIACIRSELVTVVECSAYFAQINANQNYLRKYCKQLLSRRYYLSNYRWLSPSPINASTWIALVVSTVSSIYRFNANIWLGCRVGCFAGIPGRL